jgi:hyperosmotically inducible periplasmic protein
MTIPTIGTTRRGWARRTTSILALTAAVAFPAGVLAQQPPAPDNTKTNARDRQPAQVTADDQKNDRTDLQLTQEIRKALVADESLSTYAHNVKVIARKGKVTLKGPVRTADEKKVVETKAAKVAGADNIINQLSVAPDAAKTKAGS